MLFKMFIVRTLFSITCLLLVVKNGSSSDLGTEVSFRQNIADLLEGKLKISDANLPFEKDELSDSTPKNHSEYDFIVIGAGSAGSTIASRLSEIKNVTVLLIEAGGKEYSILDVLALTTAFQSHKEVTWNYKTESSDKYCLSHEDHKCNLPVGKVMGGSSTTNSYTGARGNRRDYDQWADEVGDDSWAYKNMLEYFKKLENYNPKHVIVDRKYRGIGGPIHISLDSFHSEISKSFIKAGEEMGYSDVDYNGPEQTGFSHSQTMTFKGEGWSANRAYLRPVKDRKNLILTQNSHVHKILIDKVTKNAYGVKYSKNGKIFEVKAKKEIILSAGIFNSPQILMLSGIGPQEHLREFNIGVIKNAPVGENLMDHVRYERGLTFLVNDSSTIQVPNILDPEDSSIKNYIDNKSGVLSFGSNLQAIAMLNVDDHDNLHPNLELLLTPGPIKISKDTVTPGNVPLKAYTIHPISMRPRSRGRVLLRSNNPLDKPKIIPNYLEDPDDVRVLIKGIRLAKKVGQTDALKKHGSQLQSFTSDCDVYGKDSDKYWECELRTHTVSAYHSLGTCKMGRENSSDAVVNSQLKVIGVKGLRVVDASVIPNNICAHTHIPVIAMSEKAADLIKMEHGY